MCTSKVSVKLTLKDIGNKSFTETRKTGDKANETESKCIRRVRQRVRAILHLCEARLPLRWPLPLPILFCVENFPYQEQLTIRCHRGRSEHSVWISRRPAGRDLRSLQRDGYRALRCQGPCTFGTVAVVGGWDSMHRITRIAVDERATGISPPRPSQGTTLYAWVGS